MRIVSKSTTPKTSGYPSLEVEDEVAVTLQERSGALCCKVCGYRVAANKDAIRVQDQHRHQRTNPSDYRFTILCFRDAPGCQINGECTHEHSWFAGYCWNYAYCIGCNIQLGWHFTASDTDTFYALVSEQVLPCSAIQVD